MELAGDGEVIIDDAAFERIQIRRAGEAGDFDKAEAVRSEARFPDFALFAALERVKIRGLGTAQIGHVERAIGLQRFGMAEADVRAGGTGDMQAAPAGDVLAEIVDKHAGFEFLDGDGF